MKILIDKNANINAVDDEGDSALDYASNAAEGNFFTNGHFGR